MDLSTKKLQQTVYDFYRNHRHPYPWRETTDPYAIFISEIMLQQTQTYRVAPLYSAFMKKFPTAEALSKAPVADVLKAWQGLGYNRRALFAKKCAVAVVTQFQGQFPETIEDLEELPGIGPYTAAAIMAFAFNKPATVVETNIRTVYIHHFFPKKKKVTDAEIIPLIERTMDRENPREWFNALMDYGSMLKQTVGNKTRKSNTYQKQSSFKGSKRQIRGNILKLLTKKTRTIQELSSEIPDVRLKEVLGALVREGFIEKNGNYYQLKK